MIVDPKILQKDLTFLNNFKKYLLAPSSEQDITSLIGDYLNKNSKLSQNSCLCPTDFVAICESS